MKIDALMSSPAALAHMSEAQTSQSKRSHFSALLDKLNHTQQEAERMTLAYEQGDKSIALHEVMIAMQKSQLSLQGAVQVRNKLVSAYQDLMNMSL